MKIAIDSVLKKTLLLFLLFAGLYYAKGFLVPIALGAVIATLFLPICGLMERKNMPRGLASFLSLLIAIIIISGIIYLIGWQLSLLISDYSNIQQKALEKAIRVQQFVFEHFGIAIEKQVQILKTEQPSLTVIVRSIIGSVQYVFINIVFVFAYIFLFLYYRNHLKNFILMFSKNEEREEMEVIIYRTTHIAQQYIFGLAKMIVLLWLMYGIGFGILGVQNFIFFAILCGFLEIVPFIGNITGTLLTVLVAALSGAGLSVLLGIVIVYGIVQFIQGWVIEPLVLGPQVKINPLFTIIALILGELVWGIPGIILAIPITAMFKITCDHIDALKPIGFLIGEIGPIKPRQSFATKIRRLFK